MTLVSRKKVDISLTLRCPKNQPLDLKTCFVTGEIHPRTLRNTNRSSQSVKPSVTPPDFGGSNSRGYKPPPFFLGTSSPNTN